MTKMFASFKPAGKKQTAQILKTIQGISNSPDVLAALSSFDKGEMGRIIGTDDLPAILREVFISKLEELSLSTEFADEEVPSSCDYTLNDNPTDGLLEFCNLLKRGIGLKGWDERYLSLILGGGVKLPKYAEKWLALPNIWANKPLVADQFGTSYASAVRNLLRRFAKSNWLLEAEFRPNIDLAKLGRRWIRQTKESHQFFVELSIAQGNPDILIVPVQLGKRHRGRSNRRARVLYKHNECGLGVFASGMAVAQFSDRFTSSKDLSFDCPEDQIQNREFCEDSFGCTAYFRMVERLDCLPKLIEFGATKANGVEKHHGQASAFFPGFSDYL